MKIPPCQGGSVGTYLASARWLGPAQVTWSRTTITGPGPVAVDPGQ
jgi:hypothetical protein